MEDSYKIILIIILIVIIECLGQVCIKILHNEPDKYHFYFIAVFLYSIVCYLLFLSYSHSGLGIVNILWGGASAILVFLSGVLIFNEKHTHTDYIGIGLIIAGIVCVTWKNK